MTIFNKISVFFIDSIYIIFIIALILILILIAIFSYLRLLTLHKNSIYLNRSQKCLAVYDNYSQINQEPLENDGKYFNQYFKKEKYHGLRDYFYAASHKSYLPCGNTKDIVSYNALKHVLLAGARAINLDIFYKGTVAGSSDSEIIVGNVINGQLSFLPNSKESEQYLNFGNCLKIINELGWKKTDAPLFLYLNLEFAPIQNLEFQIYNNLNKIINTRLMDKYYGFQRVNIGDIPVNKAQNKLIILLNRKPVNNFLNEITNGIMTEESVNLILYTMSDGDIEYGGIKTKFPNPQIATKTTQFNLVAVIKSNRVDDENIDNPKIDTTNYDTTDNFKLGVSMTFMNWQNFPDENNYMKNYLENFKKGGMVLKPKELIYEPRPAPTVYERDKKFDYRNKNISGLGGFYDFNI